MAVVLEWIRTLTVIRFPGNILTGVMMVAFYPVCSTIPANDPKDCYIGSTREVEYLNSVTAASAGEPVTQITGKTR
jgi:hypothetical protein